MFECLLCFDAWLNRPTFCRLDNPPKAKAGYHASTVKQMEMCKSYIPTVKVTAWKFPKFPELLHIVDDIERFGAVNYCAQRPESLPIPIAKKPGRRAKNGNRVLHSNCRRRNACHTPSLLTPCTYSLLWDYTIAESATTPANAQVNKTLPNTGRPTFATVARFDQPQVPYSEQIAVTWEKSGHCAHGSPISVIRIQVAKI